MRSPTGRSKKMMEDEGYHVAIVEWWNPHVRRRHDLFGFADLLAIKPGEVPVLIQTTSGSNTAARIKKIAAEPLARTALISGFRIEVHGWRKLKSNRGRWTPRVENVEIGDLNDVD